MLKVLCESSITIKTHPITQNSAYYRGRKVLNEKARKYRASFFNQLMSDKNQSAIKKIYDRFDRLKHALSFEWCWYQPSNIYFTKKGYISRRSMDSDNLLKLPTDFLCNEKYNDEWLSKVRKNELPYFKIDSLVNLRIDDQFAISTTSTKLPSIDDSYFLVLNIKLVELPFNKLTK